MVLPKILRIWQNFFAENKFGGKKFGVKKQFDKKNNLTELHLGKTEYFQKQPQLLLPFKPTP